MKNFNTQLNIGNVKYVINYHDGIDTHKDGSPFYGIKCFRNKKTFELAIKQLRKEGYQGE